MSDPFTIPNLNHSHRRMRVERLRLRASRWILVLCLLPLLTGCQIFRGFGGNTTPAPTVFNSLPTQPELITRLNAHANRVRQLQSNVSLEIPGTPRLNGTLILERPDRLRLKAGVGGISELGFDVGSNSELFWLWNKASIPGQAPPAIYYARQSDYYRVQQMTSIPIDPQWIIDATGLVAFDPADLHQGPYVGQDGRLRINSIRRTPVGHVTRVSVIDPKSALILQQALYDANNRLLGYLNSMNFEYQAEHEVSLPRRVEMNLISAEGETFKLAINASSYRINSFYGNPDQTWTMPSPDGVPLINLADGAAER